LPSITGGNANISPGLKNADDHLFAGLLKWTIFVLPETTIGKNEASSPSANIC
jgi:hypothetical protein